MKATKVQTTVTIRPEDKDLLKEIQNEFHGYNVSDPTKPKYLTTEEALELLLEVATDRRFKQVQSTDEESGELLFDDEGAPIMEPVDLFEITANRIIGDRQKRTRTSQVAAVKGQLSEATAELEALRALLAAKGIELPTAPAGE